MVPPIKTPGIDEATTAKRGGAEAGNVAPIVALIAKTHKRLPNGTQRSGQ